MHKRVAGFVFLTASLFIAAPSGFAQSILKEDRDDLLKGFDVDPASLSQYQPKPSAFGAASILFKWIGAAIPSVNVQGGANPNVSVKAPLVDLAVGAGTTGIKVKTPFVSINAGGNGLAVAPGSAPDAGQSAEPGSDTISPSRSSSQASPAQ